MEKEFKIDGEIGDEIKIAREIGDEIRRLEELYKYYKKLYRRVRFLCCSEQRETVKHNKDHYKEKWKEMIKLQCENV